MGVEAQSAHFGRLRVPFALALLQMFAEAVYGHGDVSSVKINGSADVRGSFARGWEERFPPSKQQDRVKIQLDFMYATRTSMPPFAMDPAITSAVRMKEMLMTGTRNPARTLGVTACEDVLVSNPAEVGNGTKGRRSASASTGSHVSARPGVDVGERNGLASTVQVGITNTTRSCDDAGSQNEQRSAPSKKRAASCSLASAGVGNQSCVVIQPKQTEDYASAVAEAEGKRRCVRGAGSDEEHTATSAVVCRKARGVNDESVVVPDWLGVPCVGLDVEVYENMLFTAHG